MDSIEWTALLLPPILSETCMKEDWAKRHENDLSPIRKTVSLSLLPIVARLNPISFRSAERSLSVGVFLLSDYGRACCIMMRLFGSLVLLQHKRPTEFIVREGKKRWSGGVLGAAAASKSRWVMDEGRPGNQRRAIKSPRKVHLLSCSGRWIYASRNKRV